MAEFTTRQKATMGVFIIVLILLMWQVIGFFKGSSSQAPSPSQLKPIAAASSGQQPMMNQAPGALAAQGSQSNVQPKAMPVPVDTETAKIQQETQGKYVEALSDLQMLKIQRDIAEINQAIATAKLATVTAEKNVTDLLTGPAPRPVSQGEYANKLVGPTASSPTGGNEQPPGNAQQQVPVDQSGEPSYVVISVSMQLNKWMAVIGLQGKLYNVSIGDVLPADGSVVVDINKTGVTLSKDGEKRKISLTSAI
jgi:hypothetical protein